MKSSSKKLFKVIISEEATLDIEDAAFYYEIEHFSSDTHWYDYTNMRDSMWP